MSSGRMSSGSGKQLLQTVLNSGNGEQWQCVCSGNVSSGSSNICSGNVSRGSGNGG